MYTLYPVGNLKLLKVSGTSSREKLDANWRKAGTNFNLHLPLTAEENGNPLQYSCLENSMDRGAWRATVHGVAKVRHDLATKPLPPNHKPFLSPEEYNWIQSLCNITDCRVFAIQSYSTYKELGCCEPSSRENTVNRLSSCNDSGVGWSDKHFKANGVTVFSDIKEKTLLVNRNIGNLSRGIEDGVEEVSLG